MTEYDVIVEGRTSLGLSEDEVALLFSTGRIDRHSSCRVSGSTAWRTVDDLLPLLKWGSSNASFPTVSKNRRCPRSEISSERKPSMTSALKAGWICLAIGAPFAWLLPPAHVLFTVSLVLGIIAMATHQIGRGLALTLSSIFVAGISTLISFLLVVGLFAKAVEPAVTKLNRDMEELNRRMHVVTPVMQNNTRQPLINFTPSNPMAHQTTRMLPLIAVQTELLPEIARMESRQRDLRRHGRDLDSAGMEYLSRLRMEYDQFSVR